MTTLGPYELNQIYTGDARELAKAIPDESIDLIFTDPPYPKEFLPLYGWLAETAARILKPGGLCVAMAGQSYLPDIYAAMGNYLTYHWTFFLDCKSGQACTIWPRKVTTQWKPLLSYSKGEYQGIFWGTDRTPTKFNDKRFHGWGQSETSSFWFIESLAPVITLDPFIGGGTVPAVCKMLSRDYLAFEIDPDTAEKARERVRNTQPPLPFIQPIQETIFK